MSLANNKKFCLDPLATVAVFCTFFIGSSQAEAGIIWSGPDDLNISVTAPTLNDGSGNNLSPSFSISGIPGLFQLDSTRFTSVNTTPLGSLSINNNSGVTFAGVLVTFTNLIGSTESYHQIVPQTGLIDSSLTYGVGWVVRAGSPNSQAIGSNLYLGFKTSSTNLYGWMRYSASGSQSDGYSATIHEWAYDNTGASILAGQTQAIPEPGGLTMVALIGLISAGCRWRRSGATLSA